MPLTFVETRAREMDAVIPKEMVLEKKEELMVVEKKEELLVVEKKEELLIVLKKKEEVMVVEKNEELMVLKKKEECHLKAQYPDSICKMCPTEVAGLKVLKRKRPETREELFVAKRQKMKKVEETKVKKVEELEVDKEVLGGGLLTVEELSKQMPKAQAQKVVKPKTVKNYTCQLCGHLCKDANHRSTHVKRKHDMRMEKYHFTVKDKSNRDAEEEEFQIEEARKDQEFEKEEAAKDEKMFAKETERRKIEAASVQNLVKDIVKEIVEEAVATEDEEVKIIREIKFEVDEEAGPTSANKVKDERQIKNKARLGKAHMKPKEQMIELDKSGEKKENLTEEAFEDETKEVEKNETDFVKEVHKEIEAAMNEPNTKKPAAKTIEDARLKQTKDTKVAEEEEDDEDDEDNEVTIIGEVTIAVGPKPDEDKNEPAKEDMAETKAKESITDKIEINEENDVEKLLEEAKIEADFRERQATKNKANATTGKESKRPQDSASEKIEDENNIEEKVIDDATKENEKEAGQPKEIGGNIYGYLGSIWQYLKL